MKNLKDFLIEAEDLSVSNVYKQRLQHHKQLSDATSGEFLNMANKHKYYGDKDMHHYHMALHHSVKASHHAELVNEFSHDKTVHDKHFALGGGEADKSSSHIMKIKDRKLAIAAHSHLHDSGFVSDLSK